MNMDNLCLSLFVIKIRSYTESCFPDFVQPYVKFAVLIAVAPGSAV